MDGRRVRLEADAPLCPGKAESIWNAPTPPSNRADVNLASQVGAVRLRPYRPGP